MMLEKLKHRRRTYMLKLTICALVIFGGCASVSAKCNKTSCGVNGLCRNDACVCHDGWQGPQCEFCGGKVKLTGLSGTIYDGPGNYSLVNKCSWLIDAPNSSITLHIEEFAIECGWDHLYVFDGDSVDSPLLAVFSGLMYKHSYSVRRIPEVVAHSGSALIYFFSDATYTMSGFNMTYRLNACPSMISGQDCSGNGVCRKGICNCNDGWGGTACHIEKCPHNCGASEKMGICNPVTGCSCLGKFKGDDCSQIASNGYWETVTIQGIKRPGSASHGAVVWRDSMYVVGGESYSRGSSLFVYDFVAKVWETPHVAGGPSARYGHSTVLYENKIYIYGGVLGNTGPTSELWVFDISTNSWENITVNAAPCRNSYVMCGPLKSSGHTATIITDNINKMADRMVVIFGHSPTFGYLNTVQEYYFRTKEWHITNTKGYLVKGGYGHTANWDPLTGKIYVYGGVGSETIHRQSLNKNLYSYEPNKRVWTLLADAPSARFLHTATFISDGLMLVFGGNTHNDTTYSSGAKCYSSELLAYDVLCDSWTVMTVPKNLQADLSRFGHSAVVFEGSLYIYGGFDGQMLSDILKYTPGDCQFNNKTTCSIDKPGIKCIWVTETRTCSPISHVPKRLVLEKKTATNACSQLSYSAVKQSITQKRKKCEEIRDCHSCVQTTSECVWYNNSCTLIKMSRMMSSDLNLNPISKLKQCPSDPAPICRQFHNCKACTLQPVCRWSFEDDKCLSHSMTTNILEEAIEPSQCKNSCSEFNSCFNCTQEGCIWCQSEARCLDRNAYPSSFPYGQCRECTSDTKKCRTIKKNENSQCFYKTCAECRENPACGWCDDGSQTGLGTCMPGGYAGPKHHTQSLSFGTCPNERWHFTTCPQCQCNGHAGCYPNTGTCYPCSNLTTGSHCQNCLKDYWGDPRNGGKCTQCNCDGRRADSCDVETGNCYCTTRGMIGDQCEKCDTAFDYHLGPHDLCYYELQIDYEYTFNLSSEYDKHYNQINFKNVPKKPDIDVNFDIISSAPATVLLTILTMRKGSLEEMPIHRCINCTKFLWTFSKCEYNFGEENNVDMTVFYVNVYDFQPPLWIHISFGQDICHQDIAMSK